MLVTVVTPMLTMTIPPGPSMARAPPRSRPIHRRRIHHPRWRGVDQARRRNDQHRRRPADLSLHGRMADARRNHHRGLHHHRVGTARLQSSHDDQPQTPQARRAPWASDGLDVILEHVDLHFQQNCQILPKTANCRPLVISARRRPKVDKPRLSGVSGRNRPGPREKSACIALC